LLSSSIVQESFNGKLRDEILNREVFRIAGRLVAGRRSLTCGCRSGHTSLLAGLAAAGGSLRAQRLRAATQATSAPLIARADRSYLRSATSIAGAAHQTPCTPRALRGARRRPPAEASARMK